MAAPETVLELRRAGRVSRTTLAQMIEPAMAEAAETGANSWIKTLRLVSVDGHSFRDRFTYRGDSLWWFTELFLHKERIIASAFRHMLALDALVARDRPERIRLVAGGRVARVLVPQAAARAGIHYTGPRQRASPFDSLQPRLRGLALLLAAVAARGRGAARAGGGRADVAAFVHIAFWRSHSNTGDEGEEGYIGPVLHALERSNPGAVGLVGVGPRTTFRASLWHRRMPRRTTTPPRPQVFPIEGYATREDLADAIHLWRQCPSIWRALRSSRDLRRAAIVDGYDLWPLVRRELAGVTFLQFPWSARAMDEAGAALDRLAPRVVVTYAEAGGWGRALLLEARRRGIPSVGIQHGFIYRHWLNYRHEPDEMRPSTGNTRDRGFPSPTKTLLFDEYAARHLREEGNFPPESLRVTGSPRLEELAEAVDRLRRGPDGEWRHELGLGAGEELVLVAAKHAQLGAWFRALADAVSSLPGLRLVVKCHPAETPAAYAREVTSSGRVIVLPAAASLAPLLARARAVATVNSTVAVDGLSLGVPAVVVGLPNNLSPFVDAGVMVGVSTPETLRQALHGVLYDEAYRRALLERGREFAAAHGMRPAPGAADRAARAILEAAAVAPRHSPVPVGPAARSRTARMRPDTRGTSPLQ